MVPILGGSGFWVFRGGLDPKAQASKGLGFRGFWGLGFTGLGVEGLGFRGLRPNPSIQPRRSRYTRVTRGSGSRVWGLGFRV